MKNLTTKHTKYTKRYVRKRLHAEARRRRVVVCEIIVFPFKVLIKNNISFLTIIFRTKTLRLRVSAPLREVFWGIINYLIIPVPV